MTTITRQIGLSMAAALERVNGSASPETEIERLHGEIARLTRLLHQAEDNAQYWREAAESKPSDSTLQTTSDGGIQRNGRPVGSQSDYARKYGCKAYQVCRWCRDGELQFVRRGGKYYVFLDQAHPELKARGRHKSV